MKNRSRRVSGALLTFAFGVAATVPAMAMDALCKQVMAATQALKTIPFHIYMTETQSFSNATMANAAGQIGMGGTKQSEEISTGKTIYVMSDGNWIDMQMSFASMQEDKNSDPDSKSAAEDSKCKTLPDEAIYGQPASVYIQSIPSLGIETKLWISKATHLPLRSDMTNDQGAMKMVTVSRYDYGSVQAPAHAMTMQEKAKRSGGA